MRPAGGVRGPLARARRFTGDNFGAVRTASLRCDQSHAVIRASSLMALLLLFLTKTKRCRARTFPPTLLEGTDQARAGVSVCTGLHALKSEQDADDARVQKRGGLEPHRKRARRIDDGAARAARASIGARGDGARDRRGGPV